MRVDLDGGTDAALMVLFDPGAISPELKFDEVYDLAARGLCLLYAPAADGGFDATILVDEQPPAEWRQYTGHHLEGALLRVPSGELWWSGAEYIFSTKTTEGPRARRPLPEMGHRCSIAPGEYSVDAFELNWPEELQERLLRERTRISDRVYESAVGPLGGVGCASMLLVAVIGPLALLQFRPEWTWGDLGKWTLYIVLGYALFWLVMYPMVRSGPMRRMQEVRKQIGREYPATVIVLRRLPADADVTAMRGGIFGENADDHADASEAWRGEQ